MSFYEKHFSKYMNIDLSIVIPAYNVEKYIDNTLDSILRQADGRVEVIVVNDGSTDNTAGEIRRVFQQHPNVCTKLIQKENSGVSAARNRGILESKGEYLLFFDGDDILTESSLSKFFEAVSTNRYDYVCFGFDCYFEDYKTRITDYRTKFGYLPNETTPSALLKRFLQDDSVYLRICSSFFRKKIITENSISFSEGVKIGEDTEFILKSLAHCTSAFQIKHASFLYIQRAKSATHSMKRTLGHSPFAGVNKLESLLDYWQKNEVSEDILILIRKVKIPMSIATRMLHLCKDLSIRRGEYIELINSNNLIGYLKKVDRSLFPSRLKKRYYLIRLLSISASLSWFISNCFAVFRLKRELVSKKN